MVGRLNNLISSLKEKNLDSLIVSDYFNIFYLTGFKGVSPTEREALLVISPKKATLITARLYQTEAKSLKTKNLDIKIAAERNEINKFLKELLKTSKNIGFEAHNLTFSDFTQFKKLLGPNKLVATSHLVEDFRIIKQSAELKNIQVAQEISQRAFDQLIKILKPGQFEAKIAESLTKIIKSLGAEDLAFEPIIASGPNSAKPHHVSGNRKLKKGDILLLDFGAKYKNYCADLTRTVFIGKANSRQRNIFNYVYQSQNKAIVRIGAGLAAKKAHAYAINHLKRHKLDAYFLHSLGHGVGLEVHEKPSLSSKSKDILKEGMVFSVEPGLYFENWGGVRIEDLITIKNGQTLLLGKKAPFVEIT